jgi:hypothetical protein
MIKAQVPSRLDDLDAGSSGFAGLGGGAGGGARQVTVRLLLSHSGAGPLKVGVGLCVSLVMVRGDEWSPLFHSQWQRSSLEFF